MTDQTFVELIRRHGDKVFNFAFRLAGNRPDAEDMVQEAFVRAYRHRDRFDPGGRFDAWAMKILNNLFMDRVRRYEHKHVVSIHAPADAEDKDWTELLPGNDPDPAEAAALREDGRRAMQALVSLPPDLRAAVTLCDIENLSYARVAEVMDCPVGTVRSRIHRGRLRLMGGLAGRRAAARPPEFSTIPFAQAA